MRSFTSNGAAGVFARTCLVGLMAAATAAPIAPIAARAAVPDVEHDRWIALFAGDTEPVLHAAAVPVWGREEGVVVAGPSQDQLEVLGAQGVEPIFRAPDHGEGIHVLSHDRYFRPPVLAGLRRFRIDDRAMLYLIPAGLEMELPALKLHGLFHGVPRVALPPVRVHPADAAGQVAPLAPLPLVQQIVDATSQANWFQDVRDLSGDSDVTIPGFCTACRIRTRANNYMFPPNNTGNPLGNPFASEYLENKAAGWGFVSPNAARQSYTSANSGCTTRQGSATWQNLIFTLPAQVDFAQNQQVIFLVHYDTISESAANDANNAPGADDAISGGSALLEAMRIFNGYGWQNTVKFLFVSGEEVGLCGSTAYTRMNPLAPMWRVLNMDQTAFDGDMDGLMNLYNWNTTSCPSCVAFGDAFVQANSDYGNIIDPTKIVRNTTKMCQTDHCSFWNVGVTAIDLNEDLTNNDICPCFDQFQNSTCRDTVTQFYPVNSTTLMFNQNYSWPTEKAAIALIASTAVPLYACPAAGATLSATVSGQQVQLTWPGVPPVTNYVVERADGGCGGTFAGIASTTTGSYTDTTVAAGSTYGYRVRTCPFQVSNCIAETIQGATATTTTLSSSPNPSTFGQSATFTANVTSGAGVPAGTVTFTEGATVWASNVAVDSSGHAAFSTAALAVGSHTLTAAFTGASGWANSSGNDAGSPQVVTKDATTTAVSSSANPSVYSQPVTFTAAVTANAPGGGLPTGTVTFKDGSSTLGTGALDGTGHATFTTSTLSVAAHSITAVYGGDAGFSGSTSAIVTQTVNKDGTTATLTSSLNPSVHNQAVTFTATVVANAPGTAIPTGMVTFKNGTKKLGMATLNAGGQASLTTSSLSVGTHQITAVYGGSSNFLTSTSAALVQTVTP
jgi:Bacterial Ig-like domain (group 3)/Peptidase family M28